MPTTVTSYSLLLSCPSDVESFQEKISDAVASFNRAFGKQNSVFIEILHYSKDAYSNMSKDNSAQDEINKQLLDSADMLLGIFWTKFGQPTEKYGSGTDEEINRMLDKGKPVILYFLDKPVPPSKIDIDQLNRINDFKAKHRNDGLYRVLKDESDLALRLREELELRFKKMLENSNKPYSDPPQEKNTLPEKTILWVDDHPENNVYGREFLVSKGIEVIPVLSTKQALNYLENNTVSVIISDMGRREGPREGYYLLDKLRASGNNTPFLIYAGSRSNDHIKETLRHGGQGCTNNYEELFDMVSAILLGNFRGQVIDDTWK